MTLQHLFIVGLRDALGTSPPFDRSWFRDIHSLEKLYKDAGLVVMANQKLHPGEMVWAHEKDAVFEGQILKLMILRTAIVTNAPTIVVAIVFPLTSRPPLLALA